MSPAVDPGHEPSAPALTPSALGRAYGALSEIERHAGTGVLTLVGGRDQRVAVVLAAGKICFVRGVPDMPRFGEVLRRRHPDSASALRRALREARQQNRLLGEVLLELGQVPVGHIRDCLLEQVSASLMSMVRAGPWRSEDFGHLDGSFDPRLTFAPLDAFTSVARAVAEESCAGVELFREFGPRASFAVLAARTGDGIAVPVRARNLELRSLREARSIGKSMSALASPPALRAAGIIPTTVIFGGSGSHSLIVSERRQQVLLGDLNQATLARVLRFLSKTCYVDGA